jgi:sugar lactone lactonase YvrE
MKKIDVELVVDSHDTVGEGPMWDDRESVLRWIDITGQRLHRYDPATGEHREVALPEPAGTIAPRAAGGLVLATPTGIYAYDTATGEQELLASADADDLSTRMNDGKCDRQGRLWVGTMAYDAKAGAGAFYRVGTDLSVTRQFGDVSISNGLAWSDDDTLLYWIDSFMHAVEVFDFDAVEGAISNRRIAVKIPESDGIPDGMTIDTEGYLWVAVYGGSMVQRYSPDGVLDAVVELPVEGVTCCTFAGPDLGDLYITTAAQNMSEEQHRASPHAGGLFRCRPGATGYPVNAFGA